MSDWKPAASSSEKLSSATGEQHSQYVIPASKEWEIDNIVHHECCNKGVEADANDITANGHSLEKVASHQTHHSKKSEIDPFHEPPDGGLNAWLKVFGCFLIYSNIWYAPNPQFHSPISPSLPPTLNSHQNIAI